MTTTFLTTTLRRFLTAAGVIGAVVLLVLSGSTVASASSARPAVRATIDMVTPSAGHIHVAGWSFDPHRSSSSNSENVIVDGMSVALPIANRARADVNKALHVTGKHGFDVTVKVKAGIHRVCVVSRPLPGTGGRDLVVGCRTVRVK